MLGSRVCWQLLLGWALLLGQPVFGDPDATEEPPLEEVEGPEPVPEEAEAPEPVPEEAVELEPVPEEAVELEPVPEEPEEPMSVPEPEFPRQEQRNLMSDEMLEKEEESERKWYEKHLSRPWSFWVEALRRDALEHHQKNSYEYYRPFEKENFRFQKAIGTMIYLRMTLVETNCTNAHWSKEEEDHSYFLRKYHEDRYPRHCEPQKRPAEWPQMRDCTFTIFQDVRTNSLPVVTSQRCMPVYLKEMDRYTKDDIRPLFF